MSVFYCESCLNNQGTYIDGGELSIVTPGQANVGFNVGLSFNDSVDALASQSDGKILVGGNFTSYNGVAINRIIRLNTDGSVDTSFVVGAGFNSSINAITLQPDGKILVGGFFTTYSGVTRNRIIRLNTNGSIDSSFVIDTGFDGAVNAITLQSDGKILVGGNYTSYSGASSDSIIRLNTNGSIDSSFVIGSGFDGFSIIRTMALQSDGKILVGGFFTFYSGTSRNYIIRLNTDGSIDSAFVIGSGFNQQIFAINLQTDGKILVGGFFTTYSGVTRNRIIRLNTDGSIDSSFVIGTGFDGAVWSMSLQTDGKILVGGDFSSYSGVSRSRIIRLNTNGSVDTSFVIGTGFNATVTEILPQPNGNILVGGNFSYYNGYASRGIVQINGNQIVTQIIYATNFSCYEPLIEVNTNLDPSFNIGNGFNGSTQSSVIQPDGKIIIVGNFTSYQGITKNNIIRLNEDYSIDSSFVIGTGFNSFVQTISLQPDGKILVGGLFSSYNGVSRSAIIRLNTDGSIDTSFVIGTGFNGYTNNIVLQSDGKILVGGDFSSYSGASRNDIIRLNTDGSVDTSFVIGTGFNDTVNVIKVQLDGKILVGGNFTSYSGASRNDIIRLNADGSLDTSFVIGTGFSGFGVKSIELQSDGKILVGGSFTSYSGVSSNYIIRLNTDGSVDNSFVIGIGFSADVQDITLQSDGKILVGGAFSSYSGVSSNGIIRLNTDGSIDTSFSVGSGFNSTVYNITLQSEGNIYVTGDFTTLNTYSYPYFAFILGDQPQGEYTALELFSDCDVCDEYVIPMSANTPSIMCFVCSGETTTVNPPRPVWTGLNGGAVTQMNAVLLGGNGLNS
jgi:uncharacterized delta-60 repeat protein